MRCSHVALIVALLVAPAALASTPNSDSLLAKSRAAEQAGNRDAALRFAQAAIVADPARVSSYTALADLYRRGKQSDFAAFYYAEALAIDPQDPNAQRGFSLAQQESQAQTAAAAASLLDKDQAAH